MVQTMIAIEQYANALNVLNTIPTDELEDAHFVQLQTIVADLGMAGLTLFDMDASQETLIREIASTRTETSYEARNILETVFGEYYSEDIPGSDEEYIKYQQQQSNSFLAATILEIYPNPNNGMFTITFSPAKYELKLFIADLAGKILSEIPLSKDALAVDLDLSMFCSGTYLIGITDGKASSSFRKVVIID